MRAPRWGRAATHRAGPATSNRPPPPEARSHRITLSQTPARNAHVGASERTAAYPTTEGGLTASGGTPATTAASTAAVRFHAALAVAPSMHDRPRGRRVSRPRTSRGGTPPPPVPMGDGPTPARPCLVKRRHGGPTSAGGAAATGRPLSGRAALPRRREGLPTPPSCPWLISVQGQLTCRWNRRWARRRRRAGERTATEAASRVAHCEHMYTCHRPPKDADRCNHHRGFVSNAATRRAPLSKAGHQGLIFKRSCSTAGIPPRAYTTPPQLRPRPSLPARSTEHPPGAPPPLTPIDARPPPLDGPWAWREPPRRCAPVGGGGEERAASVHTFTACPRGGVRWLRGNPLAAACPISGAAPPCSPGRGAGPNRRVRRLPPVDGGAAPTPRRHLPAPRVGGRGGHHPALSQWPRPAVDEVLPRGCSSPRPPCRLAFPCRTTPRCASTADRLWGAPPPRRASAFRAEGARGDGAHAGCRVAFAFVEGQHTLTKPSAEMVGYPFRVQRKPHGRRRLRRHSRPPTMSSQLCRALVAPRPSPDVGHLW